MRRRFCATSTSNAKPGKSTATGPLVRKPRPRTAPRAAMHRARAIAGRADGEGHRQGGPRGQQHVGHGHAAKDREGQRGREDDTSARARRGGRRAAGRATSWTRSTPSAASSGHESRRAGAEAEDPEGQGHEPVGQGRLVEERLGPGSTGRASRCARPSSGRRRGSRSRRARSGPGRGSGGAARRTPGAGGERREARRPAGGLRRGRGQGAGATVAALGARFRWSWPQAARMSWPRGRRTDTVTSAVGQDPPEARRPLRAGAPRRGSRARDSGG